MSNIQYRGDKNRPLQHNELDSNFRYGNYWQPDFEYKQDMIVYYDDGLGEYQYKALSDHSSSTFNVFQWKKIGAGGSGIPGATGPTGETGPQGIQGIQGEKGATGITGADSTIPGPIGATGPQGPKGDTGLQGAASTIPGPKGDIGVTGPTGATGPQGEIGATSTIPGPIGVTGVTGPIGPSGEGLNGTSATAFNLDNPGNLLITIRPNINTDGYAVAYLPNMYLHIAKASDLNQYQVSQIISYNKTNGETIIRPPIWVSPNNGFATDSWIISGSSIPGPTGATGPQGEIGATGPQGEIGVTGPEGGPVGPTGPTGPTGAEGLPGIQGEIGVTGATGPTGADSFVPGPIGATGVTGPIGATGVTGPQGPIASLSINYFKPTTINGATGYLDIDDIFPNGATATEIILGATSGESPKLIQSFATSETFDELQTSVLQAGSFRVVLYSITSDNNFSNYYKVEIGILDDLGVKTLVSSSNTNLIISTTLPQLIETEVLHPNDITVNPTDRLYVDIYTITNSSSNIDFTFYYDSSTEPARIGTPIPISEKGATGATGPQGATGATGATGPQGEEGLQGPIGSNGLRGATGATGPQGVTGEIGATGPQGVTGEIGATGPQGVTGETGATGPVQSLQDVVDVSGTETPNVAFVELDSSPGITGPQANYINVFGTTSTDLGATSNGGNIKIGWLSSWNPGQSGSMDAIVLKGSSQSYNGSNMYKSDYTFEPGITEFKNISDTTSGGDSTFTNSIFGNLWEYRRNDGTYSKISLSSVSNPIYLQSYSSPDTNSYIGFPNILSFKIENNTNISNGTSIDGLNNALILKTLHHSSGGSKVTNTQIQMNTGIISLKKNYTNSLYNTITASKLDLSDGALIGNYYNTNGQSESSIVLTSGYSSLQSYRHTGDSDSITLGLTFVGTTGNPTAYLYGATQSADFNVDGRLFAQNTQIGATTDDRIVVIDSSTGELKYRTDINTGGGAVATTFTDIGSTSGTYSWDVSTNPKLIVTLIGDLALTISGEVNGGEYILHEYQDGVGGHTLTVTNTVKSGNNGAGTIPQVKDPNIKNIHVFDYNGIDIDISSGLAYT